MATCSLHLLSWKRAFLVTIISSRKTDKLLALWQDPPVSNYTCRRGIALPRQFLPVKGGYSMLCRPPFIYSHPSPLPPLKKNVNTLDIRWALLFYLQPTAEHCKATNLFIAYVGSEKGLVISSQRLSRWIIETIKLVYLLAKQPLPGPIKARSPQPSCMAPLWRTFTMRLPECFCTLS